MGVLLRIPSRMVFKLSFAALILVPLIAGQPVGDECCQEKMVGPYEYKLVDGYSGTVPRQCINTCVYTRVDNGRLYCFQPGEKHVECEDEGPTPSADVCTEVLCCGSDGVTYGTPCDAPDNVECVSYNQCPTEEPNETLEINWNYGMDPVDECVLPGTIVKFNWSSGHNVDIMTSESCSGFTNTSPEAGPYTWTAPALEGNFFFACGVGLHCSDGNMKATIKVSLTCE